MKKAIWWIVGGVVIVALVISVTQKSKDTGTIKLGIIAPLSGGAAEYGDAVKNGAAIAIDEINATGGINGKKIQPIYEDGKCNGKDAASAAQKLVNIDRVSLILGGTCSGETFGAAPITSTAKVILFSSVSSAAKVSDLGGFVFRNHPSDNMAGQQLAQYMASRYKKIAIISEETDYAQGIRQTFTDSVKSNGSRIVFDESYSSDTKDFRTLVSKLKLTGADAIFICAQLGPNAAQIAKQVRDVKMDSQFFTAYLTGPEFIKANSAVEGTIIIDVPGLSSDAKGQKLVADYKTRFNKEPNYKFFVGTSYDAVHILADAVKVNGTDTVKIADYLHSLKDYNGTIGIYSLDPQKPDVLGLGLVFRQIKNGELVDISK